MLVHEVRSNGLSFLLATARTRLRGDVLDARGRPAGDPADLQAAAPGEKPFIVAQIRSLRNQILALSREATALGCDPLR